ncbi:ABC transporter permease, partial [Actinomyces sp. 186855]
LRAVPARNALAHRARTAILLALALAQAACLMAGLTLLAGTRAELLLAELLLAEQRLGADVIVYPTAGRQQVPDNALTVLGTPVDYQRERTALARLSQNDDIAVVTHQLYLTATLSDGQDAWVVGYEPATDTALSAWLEEGPDADPAAGTLAVGANVATRLGGDPTTLTLWGRQWPVTAHLAATGTRLDDAVLASTDTLRPLLDAATDAGDTRYQGLDPATSYSAALLTLHERDDAASVAGWVNVYVRKVTADYTDAALVTTATSVTAHLGLVVGATALAWGLLVAAHAVTQSLLMHERRQEIRVWRTVGASARTVRRLLTHETLLVHAAGALAGAACAATALALAGRTLPGGPPQAPALALAAAAAVGLTLLTAVASTRLALRRTLRLDGGQALLTV